MTMTAQQLYDLLPAIYRIRDAEQGEPLKALLSVIAEQVSAVEEDIDQLYENWFIETCEEWLVPYIGDLLSVRPLHQAAGVFSLRAYVANTLAYRRRKGTVAVLEELARDVTGWPSKAVEFFSLLATSQHLNHLRLEKPAAVRICGRGARDGLELLGGPFEKTAHTAEVRRIGSDRGKYNIANIGLYLWSLNAYKVFFGESRLVLDAPEGCFRFNPLGYDSPLFNSPRAEEEITHLAEERDVPGVLRRLPLYLELEARRAAIMNKEEPTCLYFDDSPVFEVFPDGDGSPLAPDEIVIANLEDWEAPGWTPPQSVTYGKDDLGRDRKTKCAVDPTLGRLAFLDGLDAKSPRVSYSYGSAGTLGGGPYDRRESVARWYDPKKSDAVTWLREVTKARSGHTLKDAIEAWNGLSGAQPLSFGLIYISDSSTYDESLPEIEISDGSRLAIVAANCPSGMPAGPDQPLLMTPDGLRPHILGDLAITGPQGVTVPLKTDRRGEFIVDGLLVEGALSVKPCDLGLLRLAHSTFASTPLSQSPSRAGPSLMIADGNTALSAIIDHCITETILVSGRIGVLTITDSIVDGGVKNLTALAGVAGADYGPRTEIERSTLFGKVFVRELYASETIFTGEVTVERCQTGCMRFSCLSLPADPTVAPRTPPRYRCQPCLEIAREDERLKQEGRSVDPVLIRKEVSLWLSAGFTSSRYGQPAYGQLSPSTPGQIRTGAEDGAEMGAFCHLKQPQREANLRGVLTEYLRSGLAAGILYARQENNYIPGGSK